MSLPRSHYQFRIRAGGVPLSWAQSHSQFPFQSGSKLQRIRRKSALDRYGQVRRWKPQRAAVKMPLLKKRIQKTCSTTRNSLGRRSIMPR